MNTQTKKHHIDAFLSNFELACEWSMVVIVADMTWLLHDVIQNGWSLSYVLIFIMMLSGFVGTALVIHRHHRDYTNKMKKRTIFGRRKERAKKVEVLKTARPEVITL